MDVGDKAPDFEAVDQHGQRVTLSVLLEDGPVVLFFYPKAMTSGCTKESCHFRDLAGEFAELGAQRIGISVDSVDRQARFDAANDLGYPLLSDPDRSIAATFGTKRFGILGTRRITFVIDTDRTILGEIRSETRMQEHADVALRVLRESRGTDGPS